MAVLFRLLLWAVCCGILNGCSTGMQHSTGMARARARVSDADVGELPGAMSLAEMERRLGPGERQAGASVTYRAGDHPGSFFWAYYYAPKRANLLEEDTFVHHIVRADAWGKGGKVVWPEAKMALTAVQAEQELAELYGESGAGRAGRTRR